MRRGLKRLFLRLGLLMVSFLLVMSTTFSTQAQDTGRFFPETNHYINGLFRAFWESNGGLYIFGFPITEEYISPQTGLKTQYFERARFEEKFVNGQPYVDLGKLGLEITGGRSYPKAQPIQNTPQKRYIPQSQYIIKFGFKEIWETYGADRIFGLPISNEMNETLPDGSTRTVQYFERARFEYWPEMPPGQRVILSHLGRLLAPAEATAPAAPDAGSGQSQQPAQSQSIPQDINASVTPKQGPVGTEFRFEAEGFEANEEVSIWLTGPYQTVQEHEKVKANDDGKIGDKVEPIESDDLTPGIWIVTAQGIDSEDQAFGHFLVEGQQASQPAATGGGFGQPVSGIPSPVEECSQNAPTPVEGPQAWMTKNTVDADEDETIRVCIRFILNGQVMKDQEARGVIHYKDGDVWIGPEDTRDEDGVASIKFKVEGKEAGYPVRVDTEVIYEGQSYYAQTSFTPE